MRISDWISDVCSSDLPACGEVAPGLVGAASAASSSSLPCEGRGGLGRAGEGCLWASPQTGDTPSQPPPAFAGGGRSEERRGGEEWRSTCNSRWAPDH